ncbi:hypothetical protein Anapl_18458 [Anas platyrhynchos]|uniref:Uncharacterized protein n=1 Tax=Anas platyrhynchos TaxID=8839 RepID=R0J7V9_ANAPL|nr:hypothetical protein Anapl_18458 [Anas platyrhynchos]
MTTAFAMQVLINFTFYYFLYLEKEILFQYGDVSTTESSKHPLFGAKLFSAAGCSQGLSTTKGSELQAPWCSRSQSLCWACEKVKLFPKVAVLDTLEIIPFVVVLSCEGHITLTTSETRTQESVMVQQEQRIEAFLLETKPPSSLLSLGCLQPSAVTLCIIDTIPSLGQQKGKGRLVSTHYSKKKIVQNADLILGDGNLVN